MIVVCSSYIAALLLTTFIGFAPAADIPEHACGHTSSWLCKNRYKKRDDQCEPIKILGHAIASGGTFVCDFAYVKESDYRRAMTDVELQLEIT